MQQQEKKSNKKDNNRNKLEPVMKLLSDERYAEKSVKGVPTGRSYSVRTYATLIDNEGVTREQKSYVRWHN